jgi:hypothetical protein
VARLPVLAALEAAEARAGLDDEGLSQAGAATPTRTLKLQLQERAAATFVIAGTMRFFPQPATAAGRWGGRRQRMTNLAWSHPIAPSTYYAPPADPGGGTQPATDPAGDDPFSSGLTPDALMIYCRTRLDSIDVQIRASFDGQRQNGAIVGQINALAEQLKGNGADIKDPTAIRQLEQNFNALIHSIQATDPNSPVLPGLIRTYNTLVWSGDGGKAFNHSTDPAAPDMIQPDLYPPDKGSAQGDNVLGAPELQGYTQALSDAASRLNSDSELQMIQLQSLMSQRQTAIALTTNLVQSLGDQENKVVANIGH